VEGVIDHTRNSRIVAASAANVRYAPAVEWPPVIATSRPITRRVSDSTFSVITTIDAELSGREVHSPFSNLKGLGTDCRWDVDFCIFYGGIASLTASKEGNKYQESSGLLVPRHPFELGRSAAAELTTTHLKRLQDQGLRIVCKELLETI